MAEGRRMTAVREAVEQILPAGARLVPAWYPLPSPLLLVRTEDPGTGGLSEG